MNNASVNTRDDNMGILQHVKNAHTPSALHTQFLSNGCVNVKLFLHVAKQLGGKVCHDLKQTS